LKAKISRPEELLPILTRAHVTAGTVRNNKVTLKCWICRPFKFGLFQAEDPGIAGNGQAHLVFSSQPMLYQTGFSSAADPPLRKFPPISTTPSTIPMLSNLPTAFLC